LAATAQCQGATLYVSGPAVVDLAGNPISPATAPVSGDTTAPQVTVTIQPEPASAVTVSFILSFSESMATSATPGVYFKRDCNQTQVIQVVNLTWRDNYALEGYARRVHMEDFAEEGLNSLYISDLKPAYDRCMNPLSGQVRQFIIDKTAPAIAKVDGPDNGECCSTDTPVFTVAVSDTLPPCTSSYTGVIALEYLASPATSSWQTVPVNPPSISASISFTTTFALSPDSAYSVWVRSVDAASNRSSTVLYTFNLDTTPPTIDSAEFITDTQMVINFSEPVNVVHPESFALPSVHADSLSWPTALEDITSVTVTVSGLTVQCTDSTLSVSYGAVVDLCGNPIVSGTVAVSPDTTKPVFEDAWFLSCSSMDVLFSEALSDATIPATGFSSAYCSFDTASATLDTTNQRLVHITGITNLDPAYQASGIDDR